MQSQNLITIMKVRIFVAHHLEAKTSLYAEDLQINMHLRVEFPYVFPSSLVLWNLFI